MGQIARKNMVNQDLTKSPCRFGTVNGYFANGTGPDPQAMDARS
jgi:hypothetical protein